MTMASFADKASLSARPRRRASHPIVEVLPLAPGCDPVIRPDANDRRTVIAVVPLVRVLDDPGCRLVVPEDRVPGHVVTTGRRLEEREQVLPSVEPIQERIEVFDILREAVGDGCRITAGPAVGGTVEERATLVLRHAAGPASACGSAADSPPSGSASGDPAASDSLASGSASGDPAAAFDLDLGRAFDPFVASVRAATS